MKTLLLRAAPLMLCLGLPQSATWAQAEPSTSAAIAPAPAPAVLTAEQWRADLAFMAAEMERRHANLYHEISRERFAAAVADLDSRIPRLQRNEIIVGMMRLAAMVGDGHSNVSPLKDSKFAFPSLPLKLYLFEDGIFIRAVAPGQEALLGARVEAVGGVTAEEAIRRVGEISPRDNVITPRLYAPVFLAMPDILQALGISPRRDSATLTLSKGKKKWTVTVPAGAVDPNWPADTDISLVTPAGWLDARTAQPPMWLQDPLNYHRLIALPEEKALYVQLNMVADIENESLTQLGEKILAAAQAANPRAIILDLRLNRGGNGNLRTGLIRSLIKAEDEDTHLFVLTWRGTFSASQFILDDLDRLTKAVFIGEPASSKPSSFGDSYRIVLPNSGITVRVAIYWWQNGQNMRPWTGVDVAAPLSLADYAAGRDPALESALRWQPRPPLGEMLTAAGKEGGMPAIDRTLAGWEADAANRYVDLESQLAEAGQSLGWAKKYDEAIGLLELASRRFPRSSNIANVLAYVADWAGRHELALREGRRALELEPNHRLARSLVDRLSPPN